MRSTYRENSEQSRHSFNTSIGSSHSENSVHKYPLNKRPNHSHFGPNDKYCDRHEPLSKRPNLEYNNYSEKSLRMMRSMGYERNKGLGISGQGIIEPVAASEQKGRRGLGLRLDSLDAAAGKFDPNKECVTLNETVNWLHNTSNGLDDISRDVLVSWLKIGHRLLTIDNEDKFCDRDVLHEILNSKTVFDKIDPVEMRRARTRSNPFETIRGSIFLNRAAVKMANMDAILDFMFTEPKDESGVSLVKDLLYFADVSTNLESYRTIKSYTIMNSRFALVQVVSPSTCCGEKNG